MRPKRISLHFIYLCGRAFYMKIFFDAFFNKTVDLIKWRVEKPTDVFAANLIVYKKKKKKKEGILKRHHIFRIFREYCTNFSHEN